MRGKGDKQPRIMRQTGGNFKPIVRGAGSGRVRIEGEGADRYAGYLPKSLLGKYQEGVDDLELTHMRQELALLDVRIKNLVQTISEEEEAADYTEIARAVRELGVYGSEAEVERTARIIMAFLPQDYVDRRSWARLRTIADAYDRALEKVDGQKQADKLLGNLFRAIRTGSSSDVAWDEIVALMNVRRQLVATEVDREMRTRRLMDVEKVVQVLGVLVRSLQQSVVKYIPDRNVQEAIFYDAEKSYQKLLSDRFSISDDAEVMEEAV